MHDIKADQTLDAQGLYCPEPVMLLHNQVREMVAGEILHVLATDPSTQRDIPKFCNFLGCCINGLLNINLTKRSFHSQ